MKPEGDKKMSSGTRKPPRQMAAKACERCRRRKIKCDEFFPCGQCTRMRVVCKVEDPAEKRKEQQQSALEDRIKRLEAMLVATYTNPRNHIEDMNIAELDREASMTGSAAAGSSQLPGGKLDLPRLTLQTPSSPGFQHREGDELLSVPGEYSQSFPSWSPPPSAPASASDIFNPGDIPPWSNSFTAEPQSMMDAQKRGRGRAASLAASEVSMHDHFLSSPSPQDHNRLSIDTSQSTLDIPQIEVTSWDRSRPQSPALSQFSGLDMDMSAYCPPELSVGTWSGLSTPSIMAPSYISDRDNFSIANQSLPSHSRRSSLNSFNGDYDFFAEGKNVRRRATSDVFPIGQQYSWPEQDLNDFLYDTKQAPSTNMLQQNLFSDSSSQNQTLSPDAAISSSTMSNTNQSQNQAKDDLYDRTFFEVVHPLFPVLSPQNTPKVTSQSLSVASSPQPGNKRINKLTPSLEQSQSFLTRAIASFILSKRCSQPPLLAQHYFHLALKSHGTGEWDSLSGIQTGILLAIFVLMSEVHDPNLYILNSNIVAACLDLNLHREIPTPDSLESSTLIAAYVLDRTVALIRDRPCLLKDSDLSQNVLAMIRSQLRERVERADVRRWEEGGRLWDWWVLWEESVRGGVDVGMGGFSAGPGQVRW